MTEEKFTEVKHPLQGRWIRFEHEGGDGRRYQVGDRLPWVPTEANIGLHPDGVYEDDFWALPFHHPAFVVVRDRTIVAVVDLVYPGYTGDDDNEDERRAKSDQYEALKTKFQITSPPATLWPETWWATRRAQELIWAEEGKLDLSLYRCQPWPEILSINIGRAMAAPLLRNLDYAAVAKRAFVVEPIQKNALPVYERDAEPVEETPAQRFKRLLGGSK